MDCGVLKTLSNNKNKLEPSQSRIELYEDKHANYQNKFNFLVATIRHYKKSGKVLDIGCSSGILLKLLNELGFEVFGIEPNYKAYLEAKKKLGSAVFNGDLNKYINKNKHKYDVIIYNHVLEHIKNPRVELVMAQKILRKDGLFVFGLPNTSNIIFLLRKKFWESVMANEHIWHFSKSQFINLLSKLKIDIKKIHYSNHDRADYPLLKRLYFYLLVILNKIFKTGEAMLVIASKKERSKL
ncbi:MAG: class I SAM-dependent methyltransferase [Patescibacteria group bacterium]